MVGERSEGLTSRCDYNFPQEEKRILRGGGCTQNILIQGYLQSALEVYFRSCGKASLYPGVTTYDGDEMKVHMMF